nr:tape measure protein [Sphingomonas sp. Y57]
MNDLVVGSLRAELGFDGVLFDSGTKRARQSLAKTERDFNRSGKAIARSGALIENSVAGVKTAFSGLGAAIGITSVGATATAFLKLSDESKQMAAQLKLATAGFGSFNQAQDDVRRIAGETRSSLSATTALYGNFARSSAEMGKSQADAARATETFTKALKLGGASAAEAQSATLQFGQALASGVLRGDEFNSVMEASPRLARLLAQSLNVPIGSLRQMAADGKLTADKLYTALTDRKFTAGIDREFRQLPVTFDEALTQLHNAAIITFGAFDRGGEFSSMFANFVLDGSTGFGKLEKRAEDFGIEVRADLAGLGAAFEPMVEAGKKAFDELTGSSEGFGYSFRRDYEQWLKDFDDIANKLAWLREHDVFGNRIKPASAPSNAFGRYDAKRQETEASRRAAIEGQKLQDNWGFKPGAVTMDDLSLGSKYRLPAPTSGGGGSGTKKKGSAADRLAQSMGYKDNAEYRTAIEKAAEALRDPFESLHQQSGDFDKYLRNIKINVEEIGEVVPLTFDPFQQYLMDLAIEALHTGDTIKTSLTGAMDSLGDGLADVITGARSMGDVFKQVIGQIIADLARMQIRRSIIGPLSQMLFGGLGGGGFTGPAIDTAGIQASIGTTTLQPFKLGEGMPGFATGGSFTVGGMAGVDKNVVSFRATKGEIVDIRKPGSDRGPGGDSYHFEGNLMTPEFWAMINRGDMVAAQRGAAGGSAMAQTELRRRGRQRLGRS